MSYHKITTTPQQISSLSFMIAALAAAKINIKSIVAAGDSYAVTYEYQFRQDDKYNWATHTLVMTATNNVSICRAVYDEVLNSRRIIEENDPGVYNYLTAPADAPFAVENPDKFYTL